MAVAVAVILRRRAGRITGPAPTGTVPTHIRRRDLGVGPDGWLLVLFSAADCSSCARVRERLAPLIGPGVVFREVEFGTEADLHRRYGVDSVPLTLLVDRSGQVGVAVLGPVSAAHVEELGSHVAARDVSSGGGTDP